MTNIVLPSGLTSIANYVFEKTSIASINLPASLTYIGMCAFYCCDSLTSVTFENPVGWKAGDSALSEENLSDPSIAADYLTGRYEYSKWTREG